MANKKSSGKLPRPKPPAARRRGAGGSGALAPAVVRAFGCGMGLAVLLMVLFAFLFERLPLPVTLVRPLALMAAWCGAALSGYVLSAGVGRQRLLCGLACGVFYCLCLLGASFLCAGTVSLQGANLALPAALLLGGVAGSTVSALRAAAGTPVR